MVDLSGYAGNDALIRFRAASDDSVGASGWWVDDVTIGRVVSTTNHVEAAAPGLPTQAQDVSTRIDAPVASVPPAPTVTATVPLADGVLRVSFTSNGDGGSPVTNWQARCTSTDGGVAKNANGTRSPIRMRNLTLGASYRCRVRGINAAGTGPYSRSGPRAVANNATAPAAPTVTGTVPLAAGAVQVTFTPNGNGGSPINRYDATCTSNNGGATKSATGTSSPIVVPALTLGRSYRCRVSAGNAVGTSPSSTSGPQVVPNNATTPDPVTVTGTSTAGSHRLQVSFSPPSNGGSPISDYTAQCTSTDGGATGTVSGAATPLTVDGLTTGTSYRCRVKATNAVGAGPFGSSGPRVVVS